MNVSSQPRGWLLAGLAAVTVFVTAACYPGEITNIQDLDVVATFYDEDYSFSSNGTYAMPDSVIHICDFVEVSGCIEISRAFDAQIIAQVKQELQDFGYDLIPTDEISESNTPDVVVLLSALGTRTTILYNWWPGYGWWPGWGGGCPGCWGPGWGWGYPPSVGATSYETGSLVVTMADWDMAPPSGGEDLLYAPWNGVLNGLLGSSDALTGQRIADGVNQMFSQSGYLQAAP